MNPDDPRHGSYAGWNAHRATNTPMCDACRAAQRDYQRQHRQNDKVKAADRLIVRAGDLARRQLARENRERYAYLYEYYKARLQMEQPLTTADINQRARMSEDKTA